LAPGGRLVIIPFAWITGKRVIERAAAWLFQITAQSPPPGIQGGHAKAKEYVPGTEKMLEPLRRGGFQVSLERRAMPGSLVVVIVGEKPGNQPLR
jgi:hypothetical protein